MYLSIILLPLLGSIVSGFMGRKVGVTGSKIISCTCLILTSILISIAYTFNRPTSFSLFFGFTLGSSA